MRHVHDSLRVTGLSGLTSAAKPSTASSEAEKGKHDRNDIRKVFSGVLTVFDNVLFRIIKSDLSSRKSPPNFSAVVETSIVYFTLV